MAFAADNMQQKDYVYVLRSAESLAGKDF